MDTKGPSLCEVWLLVGRGPHDMTWSMPIAEDDRICSLRTVGTKHGIMAIRTCCAFLALFKVLVSAQLVCRLTRVPLLPFIKV